MWATAQGVALFWKADGQLLGQMGRLCDSTEVTGGGREAFPVALHLVGWGLLESLHSSGSLLLTEAPVQLHAAQDWGLQKAPWGPRAAAFF